MLLTVSISGAANTNTAIEILVPGTNSFCSLSVLANGLPANTNSYRVNGQVIKMRVGTTVTNAVVGYYSLGPSTQVSSENFDGVTAPALPSGWTTSASGAQSAWVTQKGTNDTGPNAAFSTDATNIGVNELVSPPIAVPAGNAQLSFRNNYDLETGSGGDGYDGGVLEIKIGTNAFTDILAAGGSFVSGGYTSTIDTGYANPLAGRAAWSGNSGGFITTLANLPAAAGGQTIQLKWRCGTDNGVGRTGWRIDTVAVGSRGCSCCGGTTTNTPPVLPVQADRTIAELTTLVVTNTATDADIPANTLTYVLVAPTGAGISSSGIITWTPSEGQGPSTNTFTTVVTDNGVPPLSATNSFTVIVTEVNTAPVLPAQINRTILQLTTLLVTNTATDSDIPANVLTYSLVNPPAGAVIDSNGIIAWTPTAAQAPSTNLITTVVTDNGVPPLSATNAFTVFVLTPNTPPVLPAQSNRTVNELTTLAVTNTATDADLPPQTLTYALIRPPSGATIDANGVIRWTPSQTQSPSTNLLQATVTDNGLPPLSATNSFTVTVREVNVAPALPVIPTQTVNALMLLTVTNTATNANIHSTISGYALVSPPSGASISSSGIITWTPSQAQSPSTNTITTIVTNTNPYDLVNPRLTATNNFAVVVNAASQSNRLFFENFDGVTAPGLPSGWTTSATGAESSWITRTNARDTAPNAAYAPDPPNVGTSDLVSPSIALPAGQSQLSFRNNYNLEADGSGYYDGGVLEIKIGAGSFTDVLAAGGSFVSGGYKGTISTAYSSPIAGRQAWSGNSAGFVTTVVSLPAAAAGQTIQLRWRCATDVGNGNTITNGWYVDTVAITNAPGSGSPVVVLDSTVLIAESFTPTNNAVDPGETVTMLFGLKNAGSANTTSLVATLLPTNGVGSPSGPQTYGVLVAGGAAVSQPFTFTASGTCGGTITPTLQLQDGTANLGNLAVALTLGQTSTVLTQNFDTVTAPALPSGWTTTNSGVGLPWVTRTTANDTAPNAAYAPDPPNVGTSDLVSPSIALPLGPSQLTFRNNYNLEADSSSYYDGGVLEIKIGTNSFTDILAAGGSFASGGYNGTISTAYSSPIAGRQAWSGNSAGFVTSLVNLPTAAAGQTVQVRWRCATDVGNGNNITNGWYIDSIGISGFVCASGNVAKAITVSRQLLVRTPVIESVALAGDSVVLTWSAVSGKSYRLQFTEGLENAKWNDVLPQVLATGPTATITNAIGSAPQRFYRVLLVK